MDSPKRPIQAKKGFFLYVCRFIFTIIFSLIVSFFFSLFCGILMLVFRNFSVPGRPSIAAQCKIVSSSVDLRSSKVCELGVINYQAKNVFSPLERTRFRCRHDYYWASVFEVEYTEGSSGQTLHALAEAPKEALPLACRPSFGTAWLTKDKFKVNETYDCSYTPGLSKVEIFSDSLFNCKAADPSTLEMMRRFSILLSTDGSVELSFLLFQNPYSCCFRGLTDPHPCVNSVWEYIDLSSNTLKAESMFHGATAGVFSGILLSTIFMCLIRFLVVLKLRLAHRWANSRLRITVYAARFRRACVLIAYFSAMGWLAVQYSKMAGLSDILISPYPEEKKPAKR